MTTATQQAAAANEQRYASGVSNDFCEADALDEAYLDSEPFDPEAEERWEREGRAELYAMLELSGY